MARACPGAWSQCPRGQVMGFMQKGFMQKAPRLLKEKKWAAFSATQKNVFAKSIYFTHGCRLPRPLPVGRPQGK